MIKGGGGYPKICPLATDQSDCGYRYDPSTLKERKQHRR